MTLQNMFVVAFCSADSDYKGFSSISLEAFNTKDEVFEYIFNKVNERGITLDCYCGNDACKDYCTNKLIRSYIEMKSKYDFKIKDEFKHSERDIEHILRMIECFEHNEGLTTKFFYTIKRYDELTITLPTV